MAQAAKAKLLGLIQTEYRNADPLTAALIRFVGTQLGSAPRGVPLRVLELGAGTAEHAIFFPHTLVGDASLRAAGLVGFHWMPTDVATELPRMTDALKVMRDAPTADVEILDPVELDTRDPAHWANVAKAWPPLPTTTAATATDDDGDDRRCDLVFTSCTWHWMPWDAAAASLRFASSVAMRPGARYVMYGPLNIETGVFTSESNEKFDKWLRGKNPVMGIRDLPAVKEVAASAGLAVEEVFPMPENNFCVVLRKAE